MITALHGNLGGPEDWKGFQKHFSAPVQALNLWQSEILPFESWGKELPAAEILMGYSLGGRLAMNAVAQQSYRAAVFISAHPGLQSDAERRARRDKDAGWAKLLRGNPTEFLGSWNAQGVLADSPIPQEQVATLDQYGPQIAEAFQHWSLGQQADLRPALAHTATPQLWVVGEQDVKFRTLAEEAVEGIPQARLAVIPECGHRVLLQKPRELADCVHRFLKTVLDSEVSG